MAKNTIGSLKSKLSKKIVANATYKVKLPPMPPLPVPGTRDTRLSEWIRKDWSHENDGKAVREC